MPAVATFNNARMAPRKVNEVAALVRGRSTVDALVILDHTPRRAALLVKQAVKSAASNAEHNHSYQPNSLFISEISVTPGMRLKRFRPVWRGTAHAFQRRSSNIRVVVDGQKRQIKPKAETKAPAKAKTASKEKK